MTNYAYHSVHALYIQGLLDEKRTLGYVHNDEARVLRRFDQYWLDNNMDDPKITMDSLEG